MSVWIDPYGDVVWCVWCDGVHYYELRDGCSVKAEFDDIVWMILE